MTAAALLLGAFALYQLSGSPGSDSEPAEIADDAVPVRITTVSQETHPEIRKFPGSVEEWDIAFVSGMSGTRILRIHVEEGQYVEQGAPLVEMEAANLDQARIRYETARREAERLRNLVGIGAVSGQQLDRAEAELRNAESVLEQLQENTFLTAPLSGVVTAIWFVEGELFSPGMDRPAILSLMRTDPVKVVLYLSERYRTAVRTGMPVDVAAEAHPDSSFQGVIHRIAPTIDPQTRTFRTEVRVDNPDGALSPGMFVRTSLHFGEREGFYLPARSIVRLDGRTWVYVIRGDSAERREIETGERLEEFLQIVSGLQEGERVVIEGTGRLVDGQRVRVVSQ